MRNKNPQEDRLISSEELMALAKKIIEENREALKALAEFPDEPDEDETSNL